MLTRHWPRPNDGFFIDPTPDRDRAPVPSGIVSRIRFGLVVIAAVAAACGGPAATPTPLAPTGAPASTAPSAAATTVASVGPTVAPSTAAAACTASQLAARITGWDSGAGSRFAHVEVTNSGTAPCTMPAIDQAQLVDGHGSVLLDGAPPATSPDVTLTAGGVLQADLSASNYCGPDPVAPVTVAFVLPGGSVRFVATPLSATDTTGVPPCTGSSGSPGLISMMAWAP